MRMIALVLLILSGSAVAQENWVGYGDNLTCGNFGYYGKNLKAQVSLLKELDPEEVMTVTKAFLGFNMALLVGLRDAGKGIANDA
jgi:hypothetical protein